LGGGGSRQNGVVVIGVEAKNDVGAGWFFDAQALGADGDSTVAADLEGDADTPDIIPPRAGWDRAECGAFFFSGLVPGLLRV